MNLQLTNWTENKFVKLLRNEYYLAPLENVKLQIRIPDNKKISNVSNLLKADFTKNVYI